MFPEWPVRIVVARGAGRIRSSTRANARACTSAGPNIARFQMVNSESHILRPPSHDCSFDALNHNQNVCVTYWFHAKPHWG